MIDEKCRMTTLTISIIEWIEIRSEKFKSFQNTLHCKKFEKVL